MNSNRTVHVVTKCCDRPYTTLLHYFITMTILINTYVYFSSFKYHLSNNEIAMFTQGLKMFAESGKNAEKYRDVFEYRIPT